MKPKPTHPKRRPAFPFLVFLTVVLAGASVVLVLQWRETVLLRLERDLAQHDMHQLEQLRAENSRLRETSLPAAELERLRADHAALPRLRQELDQLARPPSPAP